MVSMGAPFDDVYLIVYGAVTIWAVLVVIAWVISWSDPPDQ